MARPAAERNEGSMCCTHQLHYFVALLSPDELMLPHAAWDAPSVRDVPSEVAAELAIVRRRLARVCAVFGLSSPLFRLMDVDCDGL